VTRTRGTRRLCCRARFNAAPTSNQFARRCAATATAGRSIGWLNLKASELKPRYAEQGGRRTSLSAVMRDVQQ
jgi:hypothetical protein